METSGSMNISTRVTSPQQAALLIDADNFADPQAIDAAWAELQTYAGRVSVCRAYGAGPRLQSLWSVWRYLGTRTFPNLPLEKNTTDAALIADAVALHFQQGIRLFAIASGDADFAPLAARLREWGCEVWCFSIEGIVFRDAETYYDRVKCFPAPVFAPVSAPLRPAMSSAWGHGTDATATVNSTPPAYPTSNTAFNVPLASDADLPEEVVRILNVIPGLRQRPQHLCHVVPVLERHGFFDKRVTKSTVFLANYSAYFELSPSYKPTLLTFLGVPAKGRFDVMLKPASLSNEMSPSTDAQAEGEVDADEDVDDRLFSVASNVPETRVDDAVTAPTIFPEDAQALERIFTAFPRWLPDTPSAVRSLGMMETLLEESGVNTGSKPLDILFSSYPYYFEILPFDGPAEQVRLLKSFNKINN